MLNDVSAAFKPFLRQVTIRRAGGGSYINGLWVPTAPTTISIKGVLQNATAEDLQNLPEGLRTSEAIKVHSVSEMHPVSEGNQALADVILEDGKEYLIQSVANRKIGNYYKAIAVKRKAS